MKNLIIIESFPLYLLCSVVVPSSTLNISKFLPVAIAKWVARQEVL